MSLFEKLTLNCTDTIYSDLESEEIVPAQLRVRFSTIIAIWNYSHDFNKHFLECVWVNVVDVNVDVAENGHNIKE